jgi:hypothetical protein
MTDVVQKPDLGRFGAHKERQEAMAVTTPPYAGGAGADTRKTDPVNARNN